MSVFIKIYIKAIKYYHSQTTKKQCHFCNSMKSFKPYLKDKGKLIIWDKCTTDHGPGEKTEKAEIKGC